MFEADRGTCGNRWPVVRLRAGSSTEIVLLSREFFCLTTHWNRCTVPCAGEGCALCEILPARGLFYLAAMCMGRVHLVELGALSAANLEQHAKLLHSGLRQGLVFSLSRRTGKSPVHSEVVREQASVSPIPLLQLSAHVLALYKYPPPNPAETIEAYELRVRAIAQRRNQLLATQILQAKSERV